MWSLGILPAGISHTTRWPCPLIQNKQTCKINHWDKTHPKRTSRFLQKANIEAQDKIPSKKIETNISQKPIMTHINVKTLKKNKLYTSSDASSLTPPMFATFNSHFQNLPTRSRTNDFPEYLALDLWWINSTVESTPTRWSLDKKPWWEGSQKCFKHASSGPKNLNVLFGHFA